MNDSRPINASNCGAWIGPDGSTRFQVWAPYAHEIALRLLEPERLIPLLSVEHGYHRATVPGLAPGALYCYRLENARDRPDPASRFQPRGVHGPSAVMDPHFAWTDEAWRGVARDQLVIYEVHVGAFTAAGTFTAVIEHLDELADLGVTAIELMPIAQFPGERNWGYDGVHPFAPQNTYGGPAGLKALVDACHQRGLAVLLDVVYNHLGPEGNYLAEFGPYFTDRYRTPWGQAINFDGPGSDAVRDYFIANAGYWLSEFHFDGLRLDATHAIFDRSARPFLAELAAAIDDVGQKLGREIVVIAEHNANDVRVVSGAASGGYGLSGQLIDDFQRTLHACLTGERHRYYADFGSVADVGQAIAAGFVLQGQYSHYRKCRWGSNAKHLAADRFVAYSQCHDSVGNRGDGKRLGHLVDFERVKLAAAITLLSPSIPLLFMGEEYDEASPFHFFVSFLDEELAAAVREGRQRELADGANRPPPPDPQAKETFEHSKLCRRSHRPNQGRHLREFYRELLRLRRAWPAVRQADRSHGNVKLCAGEQAILAVRVTADEAICAVFNLSAEVVAVPLAPPPSREWQVLLDSADSRWLGRRSDDLPVLESGTLRVNPYSGVLLGARFDRDTWQG